MPLYQRSGTTSLAVPEQLDGLCGDVPQDLHAFRSRVAEFGPRVRRNQWRRNRVDVDTVPARLVVGSEQLAHQLGGERRQRHRRRVLDGVVRRSSQLEEPRQVPRLRLRRIRPGIRVSVVVLAEER